LIQKYNEYIYRILVYVREENFRIFCILFYFYLFLFIFVHVLFRNKLEILTRYASFRRTKIFSKSFPNFDRNKISVSIYMEQIVSSGIAEDFPDFVGRSSSRDNEDLSDVRTGDHTNIWRVLSLHVYYFMRMRVMCTHTQT